MRLTSLNWACRWRFSSQVFTTDCMTILNMYMQNDAILELKVARNEVKNASFARRSAHRDSRIWRPNWLNRPQSASDARAEDDGRSNRLTPTHRFCHSAIFHPITPYNVWFFWVSRHRSIILAKKMETFSGRFWEIPGNARKLELSKTLVDHKNALVFYQAISGKSSWNFSYRWTQYQ